MASLIGVDIRQFLEREPDAARRLLHDPANLWGTHAVAHVLEMQARHAEGIAYLEGLERHWIDASNLAHHLWWHRALYHLERCEFDTVLELYDKRFRNLTSALTQSQPELCIDIQNAASMLFRLEQQGVDVGGRWIEIADKAEQRIGDCLSAFTVPRWVMALAAAGRDTAAQRMIAAMREFGHSEQALAPIVGRCPEAVTAGAAQESVASESLLILPAVEIIGARVEAVSFDNFVGSGAQAPR